MGLPHSVLRLKRIPRLENRLPIAERVQGARATQFNRRALEAGDKAVKQ
jgi:hypothetical protein